MQGGHLYSLENVHKGTHVLEEGRRKILVVDKLTFTSAAAITAITNDRSLRFPSLASWIFSRMILHASKTIIDGSNCIVLIALLPATLTLSDSVAIV